MRMPQYQSAAGLDHTLPTDRIRRKALAGVFLALSLNVLVGYAGWRAILAAEQQFGWVAHAQQVAVQLQAILDDVVDTDAGARGFGLSGMEPLLDIYVAGIRASGSDLGRLRQLSADNPDQQRSLDALKPQVESVYAFADEMVATRR